MSMIEGVLMGMAARTRQRTEAEDREALKKKREQEDEDRAFAMSERQRAIQMRTDMGRAAATVEPVEVKQDRPDTMDNRDVGQPGEAALPTAGYDVAGKRFTDKAAATKAASDANTPQAVTTRMADVAMRNGDPVQAQKLRTGAMEEQAAQFKLNDAMRADIDARFNADLQANVKDWGSLEKFVSDSASDGSGGKVKYRISVSPDGKNRVVNVVGEDGSLYPTEKVIPNTPDGLATAIAELARMPAEKKLAHLHNKAQLAQQAERDAATAKYHEGMLKVSQQNADTQEQYRKDQAAALLAKSAPGAAPIWDDKADAFLRERYTSKHPETGTSTVDGDGLVFAKQIALAAARDKFGGDTTSALGQAFDIDSKLVAEANGDPKVLRELRAKALKALNSGPTTTRPASKAETITEDVQATKPKGYLVDINGRRAAYGTANMSDFADSAVGGNTAAAGAPTMASRVTAAAPASADPPEGKALDAATAARAVAEQELRKWGQVQRARDPQGYAAAVAQRDAAVQKEADARRAWQALVAQDAPAFVRMQAAAAKR